MALQIYNTLSHRKEIFEPRDPGKVSIYSCGLTPQGPAHIGHMRGALIFDVIRRWLTYRELDVTMIQNFTDIDDKIIRKAADEGVSTQELATRFEQAYLADWNSLGILPVRFVRVTDNMPVIVDLIADLVRTGHAYAADNGDVYYSVSTFPEYGKLSRRDPDDMDAGSRIEIDPAKRDPLDFALWKAARDGEPFWPSPWGAGRPGWHIECSALSLDMLGMSFDIHTGGIDLLFPHHENEIAQSEAARGGAPFARYWMHWGAVNTQGTKMSKSLGNFFTIREVLSEYSPQVVRLYLLSTLYRNPIEYAPERLAETARSYERLSTALSVARQIAGGITGEPIPAAVERFAAAMDDDFNTAQALGSIFEVMGELNRLIAGGSSDQLQVASHAATIRLLLSHFGIEVDDREAQKDDTLTADLIEKAITWRKTAREAKQFALADMIRNDLSSVGIVLEDRPQGTTWRRE